MPNNKRKNPIKNFFRNNKVIKNNFDLLNKSLNDIYSNTYSDPKDNLTSAKNIRNNIDNHIDNILDKTYTNNSIGNITKLYSKLAKENGTDEKDLSKAIQDIFNDQTISANIMSTWMEQKWVKERDDEIDMILKYVPRLKEAMACKKDCVLSADHFAKDFISYHNLCSNGKDELFAKRMEEIKKTYDLCDKYESWYDEAQIYGETFVYIAPYSREFERLLNDRKNSSTYKTIGETTISIINESKGVNTSETFSADIVQNVNVTINTSGLLKSSAEALSKARTLSESTKLSSMSSLFESAILNESNNKIDEKIIPDNLEMPKEDDSNSLSSEMIIDGKSSNSEYNISVPGCIVKTLERANTIPIDIDDVRIGYWYVEVNDYQTEGNVLYNTISPSDSINTIAGSNVTDRDRIARSENRDKVIGFISNKLNKIIDDKFINSNQDLRSELYQILKYSNLFNNAESASNGNITISFLSAEDVVHICFKKDPVTKRGISDLAYSMFPAKLYASLYITNVLGQITRGQDKRVYYVKQNVETNISKTMLNVLNQIKKGNFGARQMENLSNVLNITGKFNDYLIPLSPSGDAPIQFEIMPGQQFTDNSEIMHLLEKMAVDATEISYDLIEARQSLDYAIQATMSNSKLMRLTYKRQDMYEIFLSQITSKIYNYEYGENETINISLPAPAFLNATNGSQLINGTLDYINTISETELADQPDEVKAEYRRLALRYYIPSHINISMNDKLITQAKINVSKKAKQEEE